MDTRKLGYRLLVLWLTVLTVGAFGQRFKNDDGKEVTLSGRFGILWVDAQGGKEHVNTDVEPSNAEIEDMLKVQLSRAQGLINGNIGVFMQMTHTLVDSGVIEPQVLSDWLGIVEDRTPVGTDLTQGHVCEPYARELDAFSRGSVAHLVKAA